MTRMSRDACSDPSRGGDVPVVVVVSGQMSSPCDFQRESDNIGHKSKKNHNKMTGNAVLVCLCGPRGRVSRVTALGVIFLSIGVSFLVFFSWGYPEIRRHRLYEHTRCTLISKKQQEQQDCVGSGACVTWYRGELFVQYWPREQGLPRQNATAYDSTYGEYSPGPKTAFLAHYSIGQTFVCFYDPRNMNKVLLHLEWEWQMLVALGACCFLLFVSCVCCVHAFVRNFVKRRRRESKRQRRHKRAQRRAQRLLRQQGRPKQNTESAGSQDLVSSPQSPSSSSSDSTSTSEEEYRAYEQRNKRNFPFYFQHSPAVSDSAAALSDGGLSTDVHCGTPRYVPVGVTSKRGQKRRIHISVASHSHSHSHSRSRAAEADEQQRKRLLLMQANQGVAVSRTPPRSPFPPILRPSLASLLPSSEQQLQQRLIPQHEQQHEQQQHEQQQHEQQQRQYDPYHHNDNDCYEWNPADELSPPLSSSQ